MGDDGAFITFLICSKVTTTAGSILSVYLAQALQITGHESLVRASMLACRRQPQITIKIHPLSGLPTYT